ncbi:apoptosis regulatory protein Siva [Gouania willdenowi]|uniref:Apoptosis regulatory protein Siva n=1 Tax=Gouania willdenowi TaxID=441366 RepID=A0A8C5H888_GOUWI|nr:apoptosis regulatory protein Siva [Gouania willdenowi]
MPKRACPFPETFSSQYKIHVGPTELSKYGVFGNQYRQEIYDKTKNLLFVGAKAVTEKIWSGDDRQPTAHTDESLSNHSLLRGQTQIGQNGRLMRTSSTQAVPGASTGCCVCQKNHGSMTLCSQCDRRVCSSCTRQCSSCVNLCCSVCTIIDYSGRYDEVLCCGCST